jgi:hypothetical protein
MTTTVKIQFCHPKSSLVLSFFFFLAALGFELWALLLLSRYFYRLSHSASPYRTDLKDRKLLLEVGFFLYLF